MRTIKALLPILVLALLLLWAGDASACPNCKEAVANQQGGNAAGLRNGFFWSILLMIAMPFTMLSLGVVTVTRAVRRGSLPEL